MRLRPTKGISIEWQELFLIVVACTLWFPHFSGKRIQFWCDNELVVAIVNSGHSKTPPSYNGPPEAGLCRRRVTFSQLRKEHCCILPHIWLGQLNMALLSYT